MKAFYITILTFAVCLSVSAKNGSFEDALKTCSPYYDSGHLNADGLDVQSQKQILGWKNNKCVYKETLNFAGISTNVTCKFTHYQIDEISSVMQAYNTVIKYSGENVDTSSSQAVQNNPVVKVWNKYLQDSSVCSVSGLK